MSKKKPDPSKYPIHIVHSSLHLCRDSRERPPKYLMEDDEWHARRPLCEECDRIHFLKSGERLEWHRQ